MLLLESFAHPGKNVVLALFAYRVVSDPSLLCWSIPKTHARLNLRLGLRIEAKQTDK
jgi:hypothetical protein